MPITLRSMIVLASVALVAALAPSALAQEVQPARVSGETRLETAVAIAELAFPQGIDEAVLATSVTYPDALAGAALAGALDAPVLLNPPDELAEPTAAALTDLGVERITLLGSEFSISAEVEAELERRGHTVNRIGGESLYETAANVALATEDVAGGLPQLDGRSTLLLASGEDFPDALAASGPAFEEAFPLLLTQADDLPAVTAAAIDELGPQQVLLFGGTAAVGQAVEDEVRAHGATTVRLAGLNRMETAVAVANFFLDRGVFATRTAILARGDAFPDALTAGAVAGTGDAPILLAAAPDILSDETRTWFAGQCPVLEVLQVVGGTAAVSVAVANEAEAAAESCEDAGGERGQTFGITPQEPRSGEPGAALDFDVAFRYDDQPLTGPVDLVLFPCANADVTGAGGDTFADADGDGLADGFGTTDTGAARIAVVNDNDIPDTTVVRNAEPDPDSGRIEIRLFSEAEDCTVLVAYEDDGDEAFAVTSDGRPQEPYGVGKAQWTS